ncbi:hypothetical protein FOXG_22270 [Fusarium oxysporum f. sp. lycopersici 4287]|uniref:Uncharacterized protein n=1 Tax=Fusarium oxysporum f. sp. lycopersici (strain 4287 / CBS 123668 / FGSC 9935 / NRRL 34936) TaxID=426428 RepID=A0A0J9W6N4_FUSO4|nr:hypothetical protein FOXG_22270 [Fusarium oxysporum f. sp. lycopersici 4287]KNB18523.1 hypothetical protein FOXG_22270 [Fusarium oxysporum f. sp. lycopersici 4287]
MAQALVGGFLIAYWVRAVIGMVWYELVLVW